MRVDVLTKTENPEEVVCTAARGDYYDGYVYDVEFSELMEGVETKPIHRKTALEHLYDKTYDSLDEVPDEDGMWPEDVAEAKKCALIWKLCRSGHFGPFEHVSITFTVEGISRACMAQITRHRHLSFDVQSQRYVNFDDAESVIPDSFTETDDESFYYGDADRSQIGNFVDRMECHWKESVKQYTTAVESGVPKEDARMLLPIGTKVNLTMTGNLRTMMHILNMRAKADAQWEVRELSNKIAEHLAEWAPYTYMWWEDHAPLRLTP